ncbi:hypothetical protein GE09DRAFT_1229185 [Coniochaeta sp. 2T2.1]|nr:hypothetical protein GE09DRAFT_1229185 [Coniochaeta sp. 2T2.1]
MHRSRGDAAEVKIYRTIGQLPNLRHLTLALSASPPRCIIPPDEGFDTSIEPHFDTYDREYLGSRQPYRRGHYRDILVNCALDPKLAVYIFHAVSTGKPKDSVPLETLSVETCDGLVFDLRPQNTFSAHLGALGPFLRTLREGLCIHVCRDIRDDRRHLLQISRRHQLSPGQTGPEGYEGKLWNQDRVCAAYYRHLWSDAENTPSFEEEW